MHTKEKRPRPESSSLQNSNAPQRTRTDNNNNNSSINYNTHETERLTFNITDEEDDDDDEDDDDEETSVVEDIKFTKTFAETKTLKLKLKPYLVDDNFFKLINNKLVPFWNTAKFFASKYANFFLLYALK